MKNTPYSWTKVQRKRKFDPVKASAGDLLDALEFLLADYIAVNGPERTGSNIPADKARVAIAKAKGEA